MGRYLEVRMIGDVEQHLAAIRASAARAQSWIAAQSGDPLDLLRRMKFSKLQMVGEELGDRFVNLQPARIASEVMNLVWDDDLLGGDMLHS